MEVLNGRMNNMMLLGDNFLFFDINRQKIEQLQHIIFIYFDSVFFKIVNYFGYCGLGV